MGIIREFGFALSMVQEDILINGIDLDGNGQIEVAEFIQFLKVGIAQRPTPQPLPPPAISWPQLHFSRAVRTRGPQARQHGLTAAIEIAPMH